MKVAFAMPACLAVLLLSSSGARPSPSMVVMPMAFLLGLAQATESDGPESEPAAPAPSEPAPAVSESEPETAGDGDAGANEPVEEGGATAPENARDRRQRSSKASGSAQERTRSKSSRNRSDRVPNERQTPQASPSRRRPSGRTRSNEQRTNPQTNAPADKSDGHGYAAFKLINERNIFNANRSGRASRAPGESPQPEPTETISLVGTLSSEKGSFAFFDGSSSAHRQVLAAGKKVAGYTIEEISGDGVKLTSGTNALDMPVGGQLRREEGEWRLVGEKKPAALAAGFTNPNAASPTPSADESEFVKRLMQQREQELK